jgi:lipoprotein-releasing system permease protein
LSSLSFSKKVALRYLWTRRGEAFVTIITIISVLGVAIGVMVLNIVMAVMTGFQHELRQKIVDTNSHIVVHRISGKIQKWQEAADLVISVPGVKSVSPFTSNQALLRTQSGSTGMLVRGVARGTSAAEQVGRYMENPRQVEALFEPPPVLVTNERGEEESVILPGVIVGKELVRSYGLLVDTPVSLLSPTLSSSPFGLMPKYRRFVISGIYSSGLVEYESGVAYVNLAEAQKFFGMGDSVSGLEVRVDRIDDSPAIARAIVQKLGGLSSGYYAQDWTETNKPLWDAMRLEKNVYFVVLLLIVIMASFSIISTLIMIVLEKRKDIAVLKTLGASTASIARIFKIQGAAIGGLGTVMGLLGGYLGCLALKKYGFPLDERIFQMSTVPVRIELVNFAIVGAVAFCICFFATIYPARRASSLEPSEVLRYE